LSNYERYSTPRKTQFKDLRPKPRWCLRSPLKWPSTTPRQQLPCLSRQESV